MQSTMWTQLVCHFATTIRPFNFAHIWKRRSEAKSKRNALKLLSAKPKVMQFFKWIWLHSNVSHKLATRMPHSAVPRILPLSLSHSCLPLPLHYPRSSHALRDRSMWNFSTWTKIYMLKNITKKKKPKNKKKNVRKISRGWDGSGGAGCESDVGGLRFRVPHSHVERVWLLLWLRHSCCYCRVLQLQTASSWRGRVCSKHSACSRWKTATDYHVVAKVFHAWFSCWL